MDPSERRGAANRRRARGSDFLRTTPSALAMDPSSASEEKRRPLSARATASSPGTQVSCSRCTTYPDPTRITELYRATVGKRGSDSAALRDHHAFTTLKIGSSTIVRVSGAGSTPARRRPRILRITIPWQSSGLMRFEVREGATTQAAALYTLDNLTTHPPASQSDPDLARPPDARSSTPTPRSTLATESSGA